MKLDIIIPVYNEKENIVNLLKKLEEKIICDFRILICYDEESDQTLDYIKDKKIISKKILLIKNPKKGPNSAIIEGIKSSEAEIVLIYMADDFENIVLVNKMVLLVEKGNDLIIPSRFIKGGQMIGAKKLKKGVTIIGSYLVYYLARIPYKDCTNAFKMFSSKIKNKIQLNSTTGFTFALELVTKSYISNLKIVEVPSIWIETKDRKSNFKILKWLPYYIYWLFYAIFKGFLKKK